MEEKVLTKNQYKTFKFVRGWLMALFVMSVIGSVGVAVTLIFVSALPTINVTLIPQIIISFVALSSIVIESIMLGTLLFNKGPSRKNVVSGAMLVYAALNVALCIFSLVTLNPSVAMNMGYNPYGNVASDTSSLNFITIANILAVVYLVISLLFGILLFRKTRQMHNRVFPNQMLFIVYIIILFLSQYILITQVHAPDIARYTDTGPKIVGNIIADFFAFMSLFPILSLYKALDDEVFYEHFIVNRPQRCHKQV